LHAYSKRVESTLILDCSAMHFRQAWQKLKFNDVAATKNGVRAKVLAATPGKKYHSVPPR